MISLPRRLCLCLVQTKWSFSLLIAAELWQSAHATTSHCHEYASASGFFPAGGRFTGYLLPDPILGRKKTRLWCLVTRKRYQFPFHQESNQINHVLHCDFVLFCDEILSLYYYLVVNKCSSFKLLLLNTGKKCAAYGCKNGEETKGITHFLSLAISRQWRTTLFRLSLVTEVFSRHFKKFRRQMRPTRRVICLFVWAESPY